MLRVQFASHRTLASLGLAFLAFATLAVGGKNQSSSPTLSETAPIATWGQLPLAFEQNRGQTDSTVDYLSRGRNYVVFLTPTATTLSLHKSGSQTGDALRMTLLRSDPKVAAASEGQLAGTANYLLGNDPTQWRVGIPEYSRVRYRSVYPGVDLVYYGNEGQLEYDFVVQPGADASAITLQMQGAKLIRTGEHGELKLQLSGGSIAWKRPEAYQLRNGQRHEVAANYNLAGNTVTFHLGDYDRNQPLVIDPQLTYGTYVGNSDGSWGLALAVDASHDAYITGVAQTAQYPATPGAYQIVSGGGQDAFVTKISSDGSSLVYSTYLGGSASDGASAIAVDSSGNAYVGGGTGSANFPVTPGAFHLGNGSSGSGFVTKLNSTGSALLYSAEIGNATVRSIALDNAGNVFVTGGVFGTPFETTPGAYKSTIGNTQCPNVSGESYVFELNASGSAPVYSTYVSDCEQAYAIAVQNGEAYITGQTEADHPVTPGAFQSGFGGYIDSFVTKLNTPGSALVYSTYLGGNGGDAGNGIGVDGSGNAVVAGYTASSNYPVQNAFQPTMTGTNYPNDAFVTKLNSSGTALVYSTYLGGTNANFANALALDSSGNAFVTGITSAADFPTKDAFQGICGGSTFNNCVSSAFVSEFSPSGTLMGSTYYGSPTSWSYGNAIAADALGNAYITGGSDAGLPTTPNAYKTTTTNGGQGTVFAAKINMSSQTGCTNLRQNRTVAICTPFVGSASGPMVHVSAVVNDSSTVNSIQVYVDGVFKFEEDIGNQIDSYLQIPSGTHNISVKAWDHSGSFLSKRSVTVSGTSTATCTVGEILPYVQICDPEAGSTVSNPVNVHALAASQNFAVTAMRLYVDNVNLFTTNSSTLDTSVTLNKGLRKVTVQAWDWKGQTFKQTVYVTVQ